MGYGGCDRSGGWSVRDEHLAFCVAKKKRIEDLQEKTRFGEFDKHRLRTLFQDTLRRLRLPDDRLPVFIVADKSMNAMMMHVGMGSLLKSINGIYLHRQSLHKLNSDEVQDLMGHELGHYYRHFLVADRYRLLTLALGALIGLFVAQLLGMEGMFSMVALVASSHAFWWVTSLPQRRHMIRSSIFAMTLVLRFMVSPHPFQDS